MRYPLGSFPQYGYQARNAAIRRELASANSAATRRAQARCNLQIEEILAKYIEALIGLSSPNNEKGVASLHELNERMSRIKRYHGSGRRVYFRYLGETLSIHFTSAGKKTGLENVEKAKLKYVTKDIGLMILADPDQYFGPLMKKPRNAVS